MLGGFGGRKWHWHTFISGYFGFSMLYYFCVWDKQTKPGNVQTKQCSGACQSTFNRKLISVFHVTLRPSHTPNPSMIALTPLYPLTTTPPQFFSFSLHIVKLEVYSTCGLQGLDTLNFIYRYLIPNKMPHAQVTGGLSFCQHLVLNMQWRVYLAFWSLKDIEVIFKNYVFTSHENTQFLHYKDQLIKAV
jgi:hypothetical protein